MKTLLLLSLAALPACGQIIEPRHQFVTPATNELPRFIIITNTIANYLPWSKPTVTDDNRVVITRTEIGGTNWTETNITIRVLQRGDVIVTTNVQRYASNIYHTVTNELPYRYLGEINRGKLFYHEITRDVIAFPPPTNHAGIVTGVITNIQR